MQILILTSSETAQHITSKHVANIKMILPNAEVVMSSSPTAEQLSTAEILIPLLPISQVNSSVFPNLKWIHVTSAGVNGLSHKIIDSDIIITNSSGVHPIPISEQIFSYLLMFARDMPRAMKNQQEKLWEKEEMKPFELSGKIIAIIGLGRIGLQTAKLAKAFGMKVLAVKTKITQEENVDEVFLLENLNSVLKQADFVVNCLPGTEETKDLFGKEQFTQMKPTAYFINIGRGVSVREEELILALQSNVIAGTGLDVFETEPLPESSPLWEMKNVIITPHSAGKTPEYFNRVIAIFCDNLKAYIDKTTMPNKVDKKRGY